MPRRAMLPMTSAKLTVHSSPPPRRRDTRSAPGSPRTTAMMAEVSSDLIDRPRVLLRAVKLLGLPQVPLVVVASLGEKLVDCRHLVAEQLARLPLHAPHGRLGCHHRDDALLLDLDYELVALGETGLLPDRRRQPYSAVLRERYPNRIHGKYSAPWQNKRVCAEA